jgi:hypothetical protein
MFYCKKCGEKNGWPVHVLSVSVGKCEVCDIVCDCFDTPSKYLPEQNHVIDVRTKSKVKTIKEWLYDLPEPWRTKAINQLPVETTDKEVVSMADAIMCFCGWRVTEEGNDYWYDVWSNIRAQEHEKAKEPVLKEGNTDEDLIDYWVAKDKHEKEKLFTGKELRSVREITGEMKREYIDGLIKKMRDQPMMFVDDQAEKERDYWKERCLAAERYINESWCEPNPDCPEKQEEARKEWKQIKNKEHVIIGGGQDQV